MCILAGFYHDGDVMRQQAAIKKERDRTGRDRTGRDRTGKAWHGAAPKDDDEARERIIDAAKRCIARDGVTGANIAAVAEEVGVTRRTIYRLFESSEHLIQTIAAQSTGVTLNKMIAQVNRSATFQQRVVEAIVYLRKAIPEDPVLSGYFSLHTQKKGNIEAAFSAESLEFSVQMLKMIYPGSTRHIDDALLRQLAEYMQRLLLGLIIAPSKAVASDKALREYLQHWFVPAVETTLGLKKS